MIASLDKIFGRNMREARERLGYSQQLFADSLEAFYGITWHQTTVGKIESGVRPAKLHEAVAIASALGMSVSDLLSESADVDRKESIAKRAIHELGVIEHVIQTRIEELREEMQDLKTAENPDGVDSEEA
jgi:transcriptional regulator with XRE-family HTH domain